MVYPVRKFLKFLVLETETRTERWLDYPCYVTIVDTRIHSACYSFDIVLSDVISISFVPAAARFLLNVDLRASPAKKYSPQFIVSCPTSRHWSRIEYSVLTKRINVSQRIIFKFSTRASRFLDALSQLLLFDTEID